MSTTMAKKKNTEEAAPVQDNSPAVASAVLAQIGRPRDLLKITSVNVYHNRYRVNIFRQTPEDNKTHITDTYFVVYDVEKGILESRPPLEKKYGK